MEEKNNTDRNSQIKLHLKLIIQPQRRISQLVFEQFWDSRIKKKSSLNHYQKLRFEILKPNSAYYTVRLSKSMNTLWINEARFLTI